MMIYQNLIEKTPYLYYFCTLKNLLSILEYGILSRNKAIEVGVFNSSEDWSNKGIQNYRHNRVIELSDGVKRGIHDLVCTFFTPFNTTIYKAQEILQNNGFDYRSQSVVLAISIKDVFDNKNSLAFAFSDRNVGASQENVNTFNKLDDINKLDWKVINEHYKKFDNYYSSTFRNWAAKKSAEFLVYESIEVNMISSILCSNEALQGKLKKSTRIPIQIYPKIELYEN
mgnify:FL=1